MFMGALPHPNLNNDQKMTSSLKYKFCASGANIRNTSAKVAFWAGNFCVTTRCTNISKHIRENGNLMAALWKKTTLWNKAAFLNQGALLDKGAAWKKEALLSKRALLSKEALLNKAAQSSKAG